MYTVSGCRGESCGGCEALGDRLGRNAAVSWVNDEIKQDKKLRRTKTHRITDKHISSNGTAKSRTNICK